jgi:ribosome-associated toxin RatA of RatAB toxin-antitoxin module
MPIVEAHIDIQVANHLVFALAQDYRLRLEWDPFLREMRFLDGVQEAAVGVRAWVRAKNGLTMLVEYITYHPPEFVAMKMLTGPFFFEHFAGTWHFKPLTPTQTRVVFRYSFRTRWWAVRPVLDPIIRCVFSRHIKARLHGLKRALEATDILTRLGA